MLQYQKKLPYKKEYAMNVTLSVIKADVGSVGGHTKPTPKMMQAAKNAVAQAIEKGLLIGWHGNSYR